MVGGFMVLLPEFPSKAKVWSCFCGDRIGETKLLLVLWLFFIGVDIACFYEVSLAGLGLEIMIGEVKECFMRWSAVFSSCLRLLGSLVCLVACVKSLGLGRGGNV